MRKLTLGLTVGICSLSLMTTGCSKQGAVATNDGPTSGSVASNTVKPKPVDKAKAASATSVKDFGTMDDLIAAAKAEGTINVIALPDEWANYGAIKKNFEAKYGIRVNATAPDASSKEEIQTAEANKGTDKAPDVFDLGINVAATSTQYFAPYKVEKFDKIPAENKEASGLYYADYTGVMSVGYNATKFGEINSIDQLNDPKFKGTVALNGKPAEAGAAFNGFLSVNNAKGGSLEDGKPGMEFFKTLKQAGTLNLKDVTPGTIGAGEHGVIFDWSYNQLATQKALQEKGVEWKIFVPKGGEIVAYYNQAINKDAPHPAAARLWQEYLYTAEASNEWLRGGARPVMYKVMEEEGTLDKEAASKLPAMEGEPKSATIKQAEAMNKFLAAEWDKALG